MINPFWLAQLYVNQAGGRSLRRRALNSGNLMSGRTNFHMGLSLSIFQVRAPIQSNREVAIVRKAGVRNLRVVGIHSEVGEKKRLAARLIASAVRFDGDEYSVNLCEGLGILGLQKPSLLRGIVFVEDA